MVKRLLTVGLILLLNFAFCSAQSAGWRCNSGNFKCGTERCVPRTWVCDSEDDCGDNSDEKDCVSRECQQGQYRCASGKCIRTAWRCDGENDCKDGSDEKSCGVKNITCGGDQFTCADHRCIPKAWKCDHDNDCVDGSDENDCPRTTSCSGDAFTCKNHKCISGRWKCDGDDDCGDGSDEDPLMCPPKVCKSGEFSCNNRRCIKEDWVCDGEDDCGDNSDEQSPICTKSTKPSCKPHQFACKSSNNGPIGGCILRQWKCDGKRDCRDGSDEVDCPANLRCDETQYKCINGTCIDLTKKCDSTKDCPNGDDEKDCDQRCAIDQFKCEHSKKCIPESKVCDAKNDCDLREDEPMSCNINECKDHNGHCSQICIDKKIGYECSCREGYKLEKDGRTCEDINECAIHGSCSQICENTKSSFKCSCQATYILEANQRSCKAIGQKPFLVFSDRHNIRTITFDPHGMQEIAKGLQSVIGITYDIAQEHVYWADHRERALKSAALSKPDTYNLISRLKFRAVPDDVAVDWISRKIYWSDAGLDTIEVAELDGTSGLVLVNTSLDEPRGIAVDPTEKGRHIYWTDWGKEARIEKISMDGDPNTRVVLHNLTGSWPNGISIDFTIWRIFWADARLKVIESSNLDGSDRRRVVYLPTQHPFSVTVFEDFIYWSDWQSDAIFKANKFTGKDMTRIIHGIYSIMGVEIYHPLRQPTARNPCGLYNGGCSHLCLLSSKYRYTCACPTGVNLLRDRQTCNTTSAYICTLHYCLHGGECVNSTSRRYRQLRRCKCKLGYEGKRCEKRTSINIRPTKAPNPTALPRKRTPKKPSKHEDLGETIGIVAGVVLGILSVAGVCIYLFYRHLRKNYRERKAVNFDNPVYRRTTEDSLPIMEMSYDENQL